MEFGLLPGGNRFIKPFFVRHAPKGLVGDPVIITAVGPIGEGVLRNEAPPPRLELVKLLAPEAFVEDDRIVHNIIIGPHLPSPAITGIELRYEIGLLALFCENLTLFSEFQAASVKLQIEYQNCDGRDADHYGKEGLNDRRYLSAICKVQHFRNNPLKHTVKQYVRRDNQDVTVRQNARNLSLAIRKLQFEVVRKGIPISGGLPFKQGSCPGSASA